MFNNRNFFLLINNITKFPITVNKKEQRPILSNLFSFVRTNQNAAFVFDSEEEKRALLNIFKGKDNKFSGFININEKMFFNKNIESIKEKVFVADVDDFYNRKINNTKSFNFLFDEERYKSFINENKEIIESYNKYNNLNKFRLIFEGEKIEFDFYHSVNKEIENMIKTTENFYKLISSKNKNNLKVILDFYNEYREYIKRRSNLFYLKNNELINLILNDISNYQNIKRKTLSKNIETLKSELNSKILNDDKNQNQEIKNIIKNEKDKCKIALKITQNEFLFLCKKSKQYVKTIQTPKIKKEFLIKYYVNYFCFKFVKKYFNQLIYLRINEVNLFINDLKKQYSIMLFNIYFILKDENKNINITKNYIFKKLKEISFVNFKIYLNQAKANKQKNYLIVENYVNNHKNKKNEENNKKQEFNWENNQKLKSYQYQNLLDEFEWENQSNFNAIDEDVIELKNKAKVEIEKYKENKNMLKNKINIFVAKRDKVLSLLSNQKKVIDQWNNIKKQINITNQDYLKGIKILKSDFHLINYFLRNKIHPNRLNQFHKLIFKYHIYKQAFFCNLSIIDLEKTMQRQSKLTISKLFLSKSLLSSKDVFIFNNIFKYLEQDEKLEFEKIFQNISYIFQRLYINFSNDYNEIRNVSENMNIIKYSKNIEFGLKKEIEENPFYDYTNEIIGETSNNENNRFSKRMLNPAIYQENYLNNFKYDLYKINHNHFVYGNLEEIYQWTRKIPEAFQWTFVPFKIDELYNRISQRVLLSKMKQEDKSSELVEFQTQEMEKTIINIIDK